MKKTRILWGIILLLVASLLILDAVGVSFGLPEDLPVWRIILSFFLLYFTVRQLIKGRIFTIFFPLTFIVMLFEKEIALAIGIKSGNLASFWVFLLIAFLLTISSLLLFPNFRKRRGGILSVNSNRTVYLDCNKKVKRKIENNMGSYEVFFSNSNFYDGTGYIHIENNMGRIVIHIPSDWQVISRIENNMGYISVPPSGNYENGKRLELTGQTNMGSIEVEYVQPY